MRKIYSRSLGALLAMALAAGSAQADFSVDWFTIDGGGAMFTTGGNFELSGTIGQPDAGPVLSGGDFTLVGGFWPGAGVAPPPCIGDLNGDGVVNDSDLGLLLNDFGCNTGSCAGDINGDGNTNDSDLGLLLNNFGISCN